MKEHSDARDESIELIEELATAIYQPKDFSFTFPKAWVRLRFDMSLMGEDERKTLYDAERLLNSVGVRFDSGSGNGFRDWELDWSLSGAVLEIRPITCLEHEGVVPLAYAYWVIYKRPSGRISNCAYCTPDCRSKAMSLKIEEDDEVLWQGEGTCLLTSPKDK